MAQFKVMRTLPCALRQEQSCKSCTSDFGTKLAGLNLIPKRIRIQQWLALRCAQNPAHCNDVVLNLQQLARKGSCSRAKDPTQHCIQTVAPTGRHYVVITTGLMQINHPDVQSACVRVVVL
eukprot:3764822-Amphidinium_carterae.1